MRAVLWGLRVAEHVAEGCVGPWTDSDKGDKRASMLHMPDAKCHHRWCPAGMMPPPTPHVRAAMAKLAAEHGMPAGSYCEWHADRPESGLVVYPSEAV